VSTTDREPGPATAGQAVELQLPARDAFNAVGRLVVGGLASRLDFAVADIEDLQLAVEALLCRPSANGTLTVSLRPDGGALHARLGPFAPSGDRERLERMLQRLVREAAVQDSREGEWVVIGAASVQPSLPGSP
jgi:hypothetical protein